MKNTATKPGSRIFILAVALWCAIWFLGGIAIVSAAVGDDEICYPVTGQTTHDQPISSTVYAAQTFTTVGGFNLSAIKLPVQWTNTDSGTVTIAITAVSSGAPDIGTEYGSEGFDISDFPEDVNGANDQTVTCANSSGTPGGTTVELSTPIALNASTQYAITVIASNNMQMAQIPAGVMPNGYAGGRSWYCNEAIATCTTPGDWQNPFGTDQSAGFVLFNNVVTTEENDIDSWVTNVLTSMGMNSPVGKLLVGSFFIMSIFLVMAIKGVPWILSLGLAGLAATALTAASLLDEGVLLSLIAIVMMGGMGLVFSLFFTGRDSA